MTKIEDINSLEDILLFSDRSTQMVLRETSLETLVFALKDMDDVVCNKFLSNMSERSMESFKTKKDELRMIPPNERILKQKEIILTMKKIHEEEA